MDKKTSIYCPSCGRKVSTWDGKSKINVVANCKKCMKRVVYHVETKKTYVSKIPQRNTSSGLIFY